MMPAHHWQLELTVKHETAMLYCLYLLLEGALLLLQAVLVLLSCMLLLIQFLDARDVEELKVVQIGHPRDTWLLGSPAERYTVESICMAWNTACGKIAAARQQPEVSQVLMAPATAKLTWTLFPAAS